MVQLPLPRFAGAAVAALAVGVLVAGGWNLTKPDPDQRNVANAGSAASAPGVGQSDDGATGDGGTSDGGGTGDSGGQAGEPQAEPAPTLTPLPQPSTPYPSPKMPPPPEKSAPELDRIAYKLKTVAWTSAGKVFDDTEVDCEASEDDLSETGNQSFDCDVSFSGITTTFAVDAEVTTTNVVYEWEAEKLPITEEKALHEVRRWGFRPAKTTCDLEGVELVEADAKDGVTCWVTTSDNQQIVYNGQLAADGSMNFDRVSEPS